LRSLRSRSLSGSRRRVPIQLFNSSLRLQE
jgi:hypothetical protein